MTATHVLLARLAWSIALALALPSLTAQAQSAKIAGVTVGPIENALHPGVGYGTPANDRALRYVQGDGATWVALTPFGRMWSTRTTDIDLTFEVPFAQNVEHVRRAIRQAHAHHLQVMLVPQLWLEGFGWRGEMEPGAAPDLKKPDGGYIFQARATPEKLRQFARAYHRFILHWVKLAEEEHVELFSFGVELRSWVTSDRANDELNAMVDDIRAHYHGKLTYSANWDDVDDTWIWGRLDYVGINAFFPLADHEHATLSELVAGGTKVAEKVRRLGAMWQRPVLFTEVGYTARPDPAYRPWEWPDKMQVHVDEQAQRDAFFAVLSGVLNEPSFAGFFVWRVFSDIDDVSQEPPWGFPFVGKSAEGVVRDAFASRFACEPTAPPWQAIASRKLF